MTEEEAPGYLSEIQRPMDLSTVQHKLASAQYAHPAAWREDLMLMVANALAYVPNSHLLVSAHIIPVLIYTHPYVVVVICREDGR